MNDLIKISPQQLQGAFGSVGSSSKIVIPTLDAREPLRLVEMPYCKPWPDLVCVFESTMTVLQINKDSAFQYLPYQRLNLEAIQSSGLINFKDMLKSAICVYACAAATYQVLADVALQYELSGALHKAYRAAIELKSKRIK